MIVFSYDTKKFPDELREIDPNTGEWLEAALDHMGLKVEDGYELVYGPIKKELSAVVKTKDSGKNNEGDTVSTPPD